MMHTRTGFGIVGCGSISAIHAAAIARLPQAYLAGMVDTNIAYAQAAAQRHGTRVYHTLEELLADKAVDIVSLCTPSGLHAQQALQALHAGKHVVVEKPLALTLADADAVIEAAQRNGRQVCVISQLRYAPTVQAVRRALAAGQLGRVVSVQLTMNYWRDEEYYTSSSWRGTWAMDGGGALMNQGIHGMDLMQYLVGPVRRVSAFCKTQTRPMETEDSAVAILEFASGAVGTLQASTTCCPGYARTLTICGDKGSLELTEDTITRWDAPGHMPESDSNVHGAASDPTALNIAGHAMQFSNLLASLKGEERLLSDAREGRKPLEIILAVYQSAREGKPVELPIT
ncbi:MAG: Gfo/Idh/MocA family protein [Christensenellales bacterium]|jgi:UDP-N-acetyl-2-amino-2-deoxyglucuronate dehydrogenase